MIETMKAAKVETTSPSDGMVERNADHAQVDAADHAGEQQDCDQHIGRPTTAKLRSAVRRQTGRSSATIAPTMASRVANMRGAVPGPNAKPCWPGKSPVARIAMIASAISARPP